MEHCRHLHLPICDVDTFICRLSEKEISHEEEICQHCDYYKGSSEAMWKKEIFWDGRPKVLDTDIDSCEFHMMCHEHTEVLGQFIDRVCIDPDELEDILIWGFMERLKRLEEKGNEDLGR